MELSPLCQVCPCPPHQRGGSAWPGGLPGEEQRDTRVAGAAGFGERRQCRSVLAAFPAAWCWGFTAEEQHRLVLATDLPQCASSGRDSHRVPAGSSESCSQPGQARPHAPLSGHGDSGRQRKRGGQLGAL